MYFTDVGLANYLLGIENVAQISRDPFKGKLFENLVILDIRKQLLNLGKEPRMYFYRDRSQNEIDLIWQRGRDLIPIEIKYGQTFKAEFTQQLDYFKKLVENRVPYGYVIYTGDAFLENDTRQWRLLNYKNSNQIVL